MLTGLPERPDGPIRVALLTSRRAPGLDYLLREQQQQGCRYEIVVGLASEPASAALAELQAAGVPALVHDIHALYRRRGARLSDFAVRRQYDAATVRLLEPLDVELVVLVGYLHILTASMLGAFPGRILNIHDSDLLRLGPGGVPEYRGLRATRDALLAGETETRSSIHLVTAEVDVGPVVARSAAFMVPEEIRRALQDGDARAFKAGAWAQRERMMTECWGPLLAGAIERVGEPAYATSER
jgi:folate-dependent phosphoribosylglycinamide formyltransferase PurN